MDMFQSLLTQSSGSRVSPETLEMLGRRASQMFQQQGVPLNQAIAQLAAEHPDLGNEHIKRIVEFANTVTFQEMFASSADKNIHFEVADPGIVLRDLKDGGSPAHDGKTLQGGMGDYHTSPGAQAKGMDDQPDLSQMFQGQDQGAQGQVKMASAEVDHLSHSNPIDDVYDTHVRLQAARDELVRANERWDLLVKEAREELFKAVKNEVLQPHGAGLGGVVSALEKLGSDRTVIFDTLKPVIEKLAEAGVPKQQLSKSLEKRAGVVINPAHPLVKAWSGLSKVAYEKVRTELALTELEEGLAQTSEFIKNAGSLTTGVKNAVGHRGHVPSALRQRFPRIK